MNICITFYDMKRVSLISTLLPALIKKTSGGSIPKSVISISFFAIITISPAAFTVPHAVISMFLETPAMVIFPDTMIICLLGRDLISLILSMVKPIIGYFSAFTASFILLSIDFLPLLKLVLKKERL